MFCSNLLQTKSGWGIPCFSARLYQFPDVPVVCVRYHGTTDRHQLLTHVYLTFIWRRLSFPEQTKPFLLAVGTALAPLIEAAGERAAFLSLPETAGRSGGLQWCGPSPCLGWRGRKSSGVQGWRGHIGAAGAHCGALQGGHLQLYVAEGDGPWGTCSHWEQATAGVEHGLQQQQVMSCGTHQICYLSYLPGNALGKGCHKSLV